MLHISVTTSDTGPVSLPDLRGVLDTIAGDWTDQIKRRTASGRDVDGRALRPKRDGTRSTLTDSGALLRSLTPDVGDRGFKLAPTGRRNLTVGAIHQASGRRWAGASPDQIEDARRAVVDALQGTR